MAEILKDSELNQLMERNKVYEQDGWAVAKLLGDIDGLITSYRALAAQLASIEEREAAVCPEDVGFDEYIRDLAAERDGMDKVWRSAIRERDAAGETLERAYEKIDNLEAQARSLIAQNEWLQQQAENLQEEVRSEAAVARSLTEQRNTLLRERDGEVWIWQGDEEDHPGSRKAEFESRKAQIESEFLRDLISNLKKVGIVVNPGKGRTLIKETLRDAAMVGACEARHQALTLMRRNPVTAEAAITAVPILTLLGYEE